MLATFTLYRTSTKILLFCVLRFEYKFQCLLHDGKLGFALPMYYVPMQPYLTDHSIGINSRPLGGATRRPIIILFIPYTVN
mgnify:CR=1 FL=1